MKHEGFTPGPWEVYSAIKGGALFSGSREACDAWVAERVTDQAHKRNAERNWTVRRTPLSYDALAARVERLEAALKRIAESEPRQSAKHHGYYSADVIESLQRTARAALAEGEK